MTITMHPAPRPVSGLLGNLIAATALSLFAALVSPGLASAETILVGPAESITTIDGGLDAASAGDVVLVRPGTYDVSRLNPPSGVSLVGEAGPAETRLFARGGGQAFFIEDRSGVTVEGFDIYSTLEVGERTNALFYVEDSSDVTLRDCYVHDAPNDGDVVKVNGSVDVLFEDLIVWNPSRRTTSGGVQENFDIRGAGDMRITVRGCWLFHEDGQGDYLIYAKGGTTDLLWENNVFGPSAGQSPSNVPVESGHISRTDPTPYDSENFVIRNNLFVGLRGTGAFAFAGPRVAVLANNVFFANDSISRSIIELSENRGDAGGPGVELYSYNNIFFGNGDRTIYRVRDAASAGNLTRDFNFFETGADGGDLDLGDETGSVVAADPMFTDPEVPTFDPAAGTAQVARILGGFRTRDGSPARGAGVAVPEAVGGIFPGAIAQMAERADAFGTARVGGTWDIGLFESCAGGCMCEGGFSECDGACVDTSSEDANCGACDMACGSGESCRDSACVADSTPGEDGGATDAGRPDGATGDSGSSLPGADGSTGADGGAGPADGMSGGCTVGRASAMDRGWPGLALFVSSFLICAWRRQRGARRG